MLRVVLVNFFMFLLPFLIYAAFVLATGRRKMDGIWTDAPVKWLFIAGLVLMFSAVGALISFTGGGPEGDYVPPHMEDGVIKPGRIN